MRKPTALEHKWLLELINNLDNMGGLPPDFAAYARQRIADVRAGRAPEILKRIEKMQKDPALANAIIREFEMAVAEQLKSRKIQ
jgi:hypothetical protein